MKYRVSVYKGGGEEWFKFGTTDTHREAGAALNTNNGSKLWIQDDELHREVGPARIWGDGSEQYYIRGR